MKRFFLSQPVLLAASLLIGCASVTEMTDEDLEKRFENCKAAGVSPELLCAPMGRELARRAEAQRARDAEKAEEIDEKWRQERAARRLAASKTLRMPPAGMSDPTLERNMLELFVKNGEVRYNETFTPLRAVITSKSFKPVRHEISGIIVARGFAGVVAMKRPDGTCFVASTKWEQDYDGQTYTNVSYVGEGPAYPEGNDRPLHDIECANVYQ
jgi:hypothetical protein